MSKKYKVVDIVANEIWGVTRILDAKFQREDL